MGHTKVRCKEPVAEEEGGNGDYSDNAGGYGENPVAAPSGDTAWENGGGATTSTW